MKQHSTCPRCNSNWRNESNDDKFGEMNYCIPCGISYYLYDKIQVISMVNILVIGDELDWIFEEQCCKYYVRKRYMNSNQNSTIINFPWMPFDFTLNRLKLLITLS